MLGVIIPFYKHADKLEKCKKALAEQGMTYKLFIWDNNTENINFTAAINKGLKHFLKDPEIKYFMPTNQDLYLEPGSLKKLIDFAESHPKCGICSPLQLDAKKEAFVSYGGGKEEGQCYADDLSKFRGNAPVNYAEAACWLMKRAMVEEIGLLDENMVCICSDADYCYRARCNGWQVWMVHDAFCEHDRGVSHEDENSDFYKTKCKDNAIFEAKWKNSIFHEAIRYKDARPITVIRKGVFYALDVKGNEKEYFRF